MILFICLIFLCHQTNTMKRAICWRLSPETFYISDARYLSQEEITESMHPYFSLYYSSCLPFTTCFHVFNKEKRFWKFTTGVRSSRCEIKGPTTYLIFSLYHVSMDQLIQLWFHVLKEVTSLYLVSSHVLKGEKDKRVVHSLRRVVHHLLLSTLCSMSWKKGKWKEMKKCC